MSARANKASASQKYLTSRNGWFYFQMRIPKRYKDNFSVGNIKFSLNTDILEEAKLRAKIERARIITILKQGGDINAHIERTPIVEIVKNDAPPIIENNTPDLTPAKLKRLRTNYYKESITAFSSRTGIPEGRLRAYENGTSKIPAFVANVLRGIAKPSPKIQKSARPKIPSSTRYLILSRDNFMCRACGASAETADVVLHVDHIMPLSKGGENHVRNMQALCERCNLGKGARI